jgi:hypothetical protein
MQSLDDPLQRQNAEAAPLRSLETVGGLRLENGSISADVLSVQAADSW